MSLLIQIEAHYGDMGGRVTQLSVVSSERLSLDYVPPLKDAEQDLDARCTESWAGISLNNEDVHGDVEEGEEYDENGITVNFIYDYGKQSSVYSSFEDLHDELVKAVKSGKYTETIYHDNDNSKAEYSYSLSPKVFK